MLKAMTNSKNTLTITLPASALAHLQHVAETICQPLEDVLASMVYGDEDTTEGMPQDERPLVWLDSFRSLVDAKKEESA